MAFPLLKRDARPTQQPNHTNIDLGGGERVRTDGLLRARQALSQLSYTPNSIADLGLEILDFFYSKIRNLKSKFALVGLDGVEPSTSRLSGVRSNQAELQAPRSFWISDCRIWIPHLFTGLLIPNKKTQNPFEPII